MNHSSAQLMNLPDELLLIILKKLDNVDVLLSLMRSDARLDQIIRDPCFTTEIDLIQLNDNESCVQVDAFIDRFCSDILPAIRHQIKWLKVQSTSMERILLAADYSNLSQLDIFIPHEEPILHFNDESFLIQRFKDQILTISVNGKESDFHGSVMKMRGNLLHYIFKIFAHIRCLRFYPYVPNTCSYVILADQPSMFSSTLVELHINTYSFEHCLYLLDGRFNQLRILVVDTPHIWSLQSTEIDTDQLINLKEFSLSSWNSTDAYEEVVIPTLQRMINLKKLSLSLVIDCKRRFIDGNHLKENVTRHMPRLEDLVFNIRSILPLSFDPVHLPTNKEIRCTLADLTKYPVVSYLDYFPTEGTGRCRIYTSPYSSMDYESVSNNFVSEVFTNVRRVTLFDERPFEHSFFLRLAQSFPSMRRLAVVNRTAQLEKPHQQPCDENERLPVIRYRSLRKLFLNYVHDDYVEQFFFATRTFLSNEMYVCIARSQLKRVTHDFMRDETRMNYSKVKSFTLWDPPVDQ